MKMIWAVVRSGKVEAIARSLKSMGIGGCTVYPVQGYGDEWRLYEPLIHGGHYKLEAIVEDDQVEGVVKEILNNGSTGREGDGIVSVFELDDVMSIHSKERGRNKTRV
jgi:nitrogen regulatory protein PII